ncbi:unnamed protein product [Cyclocybe aegerita]|uniref:BTB domain-containing protein n=1 Tax=Cyclocybe aegerita TaxID=1973307 RepID=A0A8S0X3J9_CYCAE|nr:unnamed protein product [Cyclocybe aegerita]
MPNHESTTLKRKRTLSQGDESSQNNPPAPIARSDIWMDDGSIVLQAEFTQFRVHRTMLTRHSNIFKDMFSVSQPSSDLTVEGCPVVHLSDSAQDMKYVLSALYDQTYISRVAIPFPAVAAMLRLGNKYEFIQLREDALFRLRSEFPSTLKEWQVLPSDYTHMVTQGGILYDIINLALEEGLFSILPAAYYLCIQDIVSPANTLLKLSSPLRAGQNEIFSGQKRNDGTLATLPPSVQKACILGREEILVQQAQATLGWLDVDSEVSDNCNQQHSCATTCTQLVSILWKPVPEPCRSLEKWSQLDPRGLCSACREEAKRIHEAGRQHMWEKMPQIFGFLPWDELRKLDR